MEEFEQWNILKQEINKSNNKLNRFPKDGEVWMCSVGKNIGHEQNGSGKNFSRPMVIIKKFNNHMFWSIPLSTKQKDFDFYYNFIDPDNKNVSAVLAQLKLVDIKRIRRKMYEMPKLLLNEIRLKIIAYLV